MTNKISKERDRIVQKVVKGIVLYYAHTIICTVLAALTSIANEQSQVT